MCVRDGTDCGRDDGGGRFLQILEPGRSLPNCRGVVVYTQQTTAGSKREDEEGGGLGVGEEIRSSSILVAHTQGVDDLFPTKHCHPTTTMTTTWILFPFRSR